MLDENHHLIQCIMDYQSKGKTAECTQYQQILHRNLVYLATIADTNQNMQSLLPAVCLSSFFLSTYLKQHVSCIPGKVNSEYSLPLCHLAPKPQYESGTRWSR
uniref:SS18 N-terminal domain-containing protein n=1 Tax=Electrophorus electricus TaxID=8005 RepID=A0A4W4DS47_ELEEL